MGLKSNIAYVDTQDTALQTQITTNASAIGTINSSISNINNTSDINKPISNATQTALNLKSSIVYVDAQDASLQSQITTNANNITTINSSISNVNNTSDVNKPISNATQTALNLKQNSITNESKLLSSLVNYAASSIQYADTNSSIQGLINATNANTTSNSNSISTINTQVANLQTADIIHDGEISSLQSSVATKHNQIDVNNLLDASVVNTSGNVLLSDKLVSINTSINGKQSLLNNTDNKLAINKVDLTGSALAYVDIASSLQTQLTGINNTLSTITALDATQTQDLIDLTTSIATKNPIIDTNNKLASTLVSHNVGTVSSTLGNLQTQIDNITAGGMPSIAYDAGTLTTTVIDNTTLTNLKFSGDNSIQTTAFTTAKNTSLTNATSNISTLQTDITTLQSDKQNVINTGSKLNSNVVSYNATTVFDDLDTLHTNVSALQTSDTTQTTTLNTLTTSVNALTTGKQDLIDVNNKLVSDNVSYNGTTAKLTLDANNTSIIGLQSSKQDVIDVNNKLNSTVCSYLATTVKAQLDTSIADIATNTTNIATNTANISTNTANISTNATNIALKSNINNPTFTTKITTPAVKITTGAGANKILTSDANGDATWQTPVGGGISTIIVKANNTTSGVYTCADNAQNFLIKNETFNQSNYKRWRPFGMQSTMRFKCFCQYSATRIFMGAEVISSDYTDTNVIDDPTSNYGFSALLEYNPITGSYFWIPGAPKIPIYTLIVADYNGTPCLYIGGNFTSLSDATNTTCNRLARMNLTTNITYAIGSGCNSAVWKLALSPYSGEAPYIFVFGGFSIILGTSVVGKSARILRNTEESAFSICSTTVNASIYDATYIHGGADTNQWYICGAFTTPAGGIGQLTIGNASCSALMSNSALPASGVGYEIHYSATLNRHIFLGTFARTGGSYIMAINPLTGDINTSSGTISASGFVSGCLKADGINMLLCKGAHTMTVNGSYSNAAIINYNVQTDTYTNSGLNVSTMGLSNKIFMDTTQSIYHSYNVGGYAIDIHRKDYCDIKYNSKVIGTLHFNGDTCLTNTHYDGTDRYGSGQLMLRNYKN